MSIMSTSIALVLMGACAPAAPPARPRSHAAPTPASPQQRVPASADSVVRLYRSELSAMERPARQVILDSLRWAAAWARLQPQGSTPGPLPVVDFSRSVIVIAALGDKPSTGYGVMVDSVAATKSEYLIFVRATDPGNCMVGGVVTQPVEVVVVPRSPLPPRFVESRAPARC